MWIANDIWTENKINANIQMHTAAPSIFGVAKYANELNKLVKARNINLTTESNWCGIDHTKSKRTKLKLSKLIACNEIIYR